MSAHAPRHLRARSRRLSIPLRWLLSLALLTPLVAGLAEVTGVTRTPAAEAAPGSSAAVAVRFALAQLGKPYRWGADGPRSFDCSGLVQTSYRAAGVNLPRVSRQQYGAGKLVSLKHLRAGDLLFYARDTANRRTIYHVGMYLGAGRMVEAPNRRAPVRIASIWRPGLLGKATRPARPRPARRRRGRPRHLGQADRQRPPAQPEPLLTSLLSSAACASVPAARSSPTTLWPTGSRPPSASPGRATWPCSTRCTTPRPG